MFYNCMLPSFFLKVMSSNQSFTFVNSFSIKYVWDFPLRKIWLVSETEFPPPHPREREAAGALWTSDIYFLLSLYIGKHRRCNTVCILNSIASGFKLDLISFCLDFFCFL